MGALLAMASALACGIADYAGGVLSRRAHFGTVAFFGQVGGLVFALVAAPVSGWCSGTAASAVVP